MLKQSSLDFFFFLPKSEWCIIFKVKKSVKSIFRDRIKVYKLKFTSGDGYDADRQIERGNRSHRDNRLPKP